MEPGDLIEVKSNWSTWSIDCIVLFGIYIGEAYDDHYPQYHHIFLLGKIQRIIEVNIKSAEPSTNSRIPSMNSRSADGTG